MCLKSFFFLFFSDNCGYNNHCKFSESLSLQSFIILNVMFIVESTKICSTTQAQVPPSCNIPRRPLPCKENLIRCLNIQSPLSLLKLRGPLYGFDKEPGPTVHAWQLKIVVSLYHSTKTLGFLRTGGIHQRDGQFLLMNHKFSIKYKGLLVNVTEGDVKDVASTV